MTPAQRSSSRRCSRNFHFAPALDTITPRRGGTGDGLNRVEGNWKQFKGKVKEKWGRLTDDDLAQINGNRDQLEGKIQERYGIARDQIRKEIDDWYGAQRW